MTPAFLHNYGSPPSSHVVVAAGVVPQPLVVVMARQWLPTGGERFLTTLCQLAGLIADDDLERQLTVATDAALERACAPAAAVVVPHHVAAEFFRTLVEGTDDPAETERALGASLLQDRLLVVGILSRTSGKLFLRSRSPRFDAESMGAARAFVRHTFRETE